MTCFIFISVLYVHHNNIHIYVTEKLPRDIHDKVYFQGFIDLSLKQMSAHKRKNIDNNQNNIHFISWNLTRTTCLERFFKIYGAECASK